MHISGKVSIKSYSLLILPPRLFCIAAFLDRVCRVTQHCTELYYWIFRLNIDKQKKPPEKSGGLLVKVKVKKVMGFISASGLGGIVCTNSCYTTLFRAVRSCSLFQGMPPWCGLPPHGLCGISGGRFCCRRGNFEIQAAAVKQFGVLPCFDRLGFMILRSFSFIFTVFFRGIFQIPQEIP